MSGWGQEAALGPVAVRGAEPNCCITQQRQAPLPDNRFASAPPPPPPPPPRSAPVTNGYINTAYTATLSCSGCSPIYSNNTVSVSPGTGNTWSSLGAGTYTLTIATSTINGVSATYTHSPTFGEPVATSGTPCRCQTCACPRMASLCPATNSSCVRSARTSSARTAAISHASCPNSAPLPAALPGTPTISASGGATTGTLTFSAPATSATSYTIQRFKDGVLDATTTQSTTASVTVSAPTPAASYYWVVTASSSSGLSGTPATSNTVVVGEPRASAAGCLLSILPLLLAFLMYGRHQCHLHP